MFDTDHVTDSAELRELRDSLAGVAVPDPPRLEAIAARGRERRRRRRGRVARVSVVAVIAATAAAVGTSGALSPVRTPGTIRTAAFILRHNGNGTATLTLNPGELFDPTQLQSDLAEFGIPAKVTVGTYCTSDPEPAGFSNVVSMPTTGSWRAGSGKQPTMTIDPSAMPAGTELSVGDFQLPSGEQQADMDLMDPSSSTCSSTPPTLGPDTLGMGVLYGGPRPAGS